MDEEDRMSATIPDVDETEAMNTEFQESFAVQDSRGQINVSPRVSVKSKTVAEFPVDEQTGGDDDKVEVSIGPQHFDLLKLIGEGAFGKVIMVRNRLDGKFYAMKVISKKLLKKKNNVQYMKSERDILTKIEHPFIVSLWFAFQTEKKLFLVMDFLAGGELFFHLRRRGLILEHEARFYFAEMILAIEFLHNKGVIHRDLKPENVLLRADGNICITDFGLAKEIGDNERARTLCGTSEYMAPEMLTRNGYGKAVDWWSLGALFYEMMCGKAPFTSKNQKELDKKILTEKISCPSYLTANAHSLLKGMLEKDMNKRLGASKSTMFNIGGVAALKQHPFFDGLDWVALINLELEPPIDLGINQSMIEGQHPADHHPAEFTSPSSPGISSPGAGITSPGSVNDPTSMLTRHFHEGFTTQQISLSVVEDSPRAIHSETGSERDPTEEDDEGLYDGFDYVDRDFTCTSEQMKQFETELAAKLVKAAKKKKMKAKKEEERLEKQREEERQRKIKEEEERLRKEAELERIEQEKAKKRREEQRRAAAAERQQKREKRLEMQKALDEHAEKVDKVEKKVKNLKKKLRDITELESKVAGGHKPSAEQLEKLSKKQSVEDDIMEMEEELENLSLQKPADIPDDLLNLGEEEEDAEKDDNATANETRCTGGTASAGALTPNKKEAPTNNSSIPSSQTSSQPKAPEATATVSPSGPSAAPAAAAVKAATTSSNAGNAPPHETCASSKPKTSAELPDTTKNSNAAASSTAASSEERRAQQHQQQQRQRQQPDTISKGKETVDSKDVGAKQSATTTTATTVSGNTTTITPRKELISTPSATPSVTPSATGAAWSRGQTPPAFTSKSPAASSAPVANSAASKPAATVSSTAAPWAKVPLASPATSGNQSMSSPTTSTSNTSTVASNNRSPSPATQPASHSPAPQVGLPPGSSWAARALAAKPFVPAGALAQVAPSSSQSKAEATTAAPTTTACTDDAQPADQSGTASSAVVTAATANPVDRPTSPPKESHAPASKSWASIAARKK